MTTIDAERFRTILEEERRRVVAAISYLHEENPGSIIDETEEIGGTDNHLAETLSVPRDAVKLISGQSARDKIVELTGIDGSQAERRLSAAVGEEQVL